MRDRVLLVVLPGSSGRAAVLRRLGAELEHEIAVLVPSEDRERSAWAADIVGQELVLTYDGKISDVAAARNAVDAWSCGKRRVAGVMCYDAFGLDTAAELAAALGVPGSPAPMVRICSDKLGFRAACAANGLPAIRHAECTPALVDAICSGDAEWPFPSILKPRSGAGSFYVSKVAGAAELRAEFDALGLAMQAEASTTPFAASGFVLEEFIDGVEVA